MTKRPVSAIGNRRPITEYARVAAALGGNPRYKVLWSCLFYLGRNLFLEEHLTTYNSAFHKVLFIFNF